MEITISHLLEGARQARGLAVIIDVFRAFSLECYLFSLGAERVLAVGSLEKAYELKHDMPDAILVGERKGKPLPGFDCGNSPALIRNIEIAGRTVIHTTSAGTQGITAAQSADEVITGSLVNAAAIAEYIRSRFGQPRSQVQPPSQSQVQLSLQPRSQDQLRQVSLVCMGLRAKEIAPEDLLCAEYIRSILQGEPWDDAFFSSRIDELRQTSGARFFDPAEQDSMPREDFYLCTERDIFPFVIKAQAMDGYFEMSTFSSS